MQAVRQRAGVSNGSLFHHFPSRQALTTAVLAAGLRDHQRTLLDQLDGADAERGVGGVVRRHLQWVQEHPAVARLLLSTTDLPAGALPAPVLVENREFFGAVARWLTARGWTGEPELFVLVALWIGPSHECSRRWLAAPDGWALTDVGDDLARGAWNALRPLVGGHDHEGGMQ
jgi:AcrR family transcriptional regulator